jgi:long-chain acyl-CoA synthetase
MVANAKVATVDATVGALIERVAVERPDGIFLIDPETDQTLTFAEVRERVMATAWRLQQLDLTHGDRVCIAMSNGLAAVVAHLGTMSGGLVAVPVDPAMGRSQLGSILRHADARAILVAGEQDEEVDSVAAELALPLERIGIAARAHEDTVRVLPALRSDDDALLMYTSGSTGRPKGALLSHANLIARAADRATVHELGSDDRLLCVLPLFHMNAQNIMLGVLYSGSSIVMPSRFRVARYWDWVVTYRCTWLGVVPTIVGQLLRWSETHAVPPAEQLRRVRFARCTSAPLGDVAHRAFEERFGIVLVQGMGMTEAGGIFLNPPHAARRKIGSLGRACDVEIKLVDPDGRELGCGQTGELLVRGPGVMRGYYKDREATAAALDAAGWLRTGDLAYRDDDGYFFHAGRAKELIIKAGTNVVPREVDEALASHPDVAQAAAVGVPDPDLGEDIGAFVRLREGAHCSERTLLDHCAARVGEFKTPSWIRFVDALPTGPTGKIQRAQLAQRVATANIVADVRTKTPSPSGDPGVAPRTAVERAIATAWKDVLEVEQVGIHDNFFALGGTSLLALHLTARLRRALGVQLSLGALLEHQSVAAQATLVGARLRRALPSAVQVIDDAAGAAGETSATLLAPVDTSNLAVPLFCVHDIGRFRPLAQLLGPHQPVYGVAVVPAITAIASLEPTSTFSAYSIEELARACVPEIRRQQPTGPYQLAGFSFGGRIAFEVAQHLRASGEDVRLLVILDTFMPGSFRRRPLSRVSRHVAELLRVGPRYIPTAVGRRWRGERAPTPEMDEPDTIGSMDDRYAEFRSQLRSRYRPRRYAGTIVLFRATDREIPTDYRLHPDLGWRRLARGKLDIHDVPGAHLDILDDRRAPIVAAALRPYLSSSRSRPLQ